MSISKLRARANMKMIDTIVANNALKAGAKSGFRWVLECVSAAGIIKWTEDVPNLIPNEGLDDILNQYYKGSAYTAAFYIGLTSASPTIVAGDTMASHAGWTEVTTYSEATREALVLGTVASQSVDNTASRAEFSINGTVTVGGSFASSDNTKGGTTGILASAAAFSADRAMVNGDTLRITAVITQASA